MSKKQAELLNRYTFVDGFAEFWEKNREGHPRDYAERVRRFTQWIKENELELDVATLKRYLQHKTEGGANPATINGYFYACKAALLAWSEECCKGLPRTEAALWGWTIDQELKKIRLPKVQRGKRAKMIEGVKSSDIDHVIRAASARNGIIIDFLARTGLRVSEMCSLRVKDIRPFDPNKAYVSVVGKGGKERSVWVADELLERVRKAFRGKVFLFETKSGRPLDPNNVGKEVRRTFTRVIGMPLTPHNMRHYNATMLLRRGLSIRGVAEHLGHSDPSTTATYYDQSRVSPEQLFSRPHGERGRKRRAGDE